ncbi:GIY-YIG nuclease family protein [Clostridium saccharoperbutylacetonicum]
MKKTNDKTTKICSKCRSEFVTDKKTICYCDSCYRKYQKQYRAEHNNKGYYLYIVLNKGNKVLYVGCTENIKQRISAHIHCHSNIKSLMCSDGWEVIKYLDITNIVDSREELYLLENALIDLYETELNDKKNIIRNMDRLREFSLLSEIHTLIQKWEVYCYRKQINN